MINLTSSKRKSIIKNLLLLLVVLILNGCCQHPERSRFIEGRAEYKRDQSHTYSKKYYRELRDPPKSAR